MVPDQLKDLATEVRDDRGELTAYIEAPKIVEACARFKADGFNRISAVTAVDWYPLEPRFEIVYHLHSLPTSPSGGPHRRIRLKCRLHGAEPEIDSVTSVWSGAGWYEREVFDLFGVVFRSHADLRRIMMPDNWEGYPLRKDYPIHGYKYSYAQEK